MVFGWPRAATKKKSAGLPAARSFSTIYICKYKKTFGETYRDSQLPRSIDTNNRNKHSSPPGVSSHDKSAIWRHGNSSLQRLMLISSALESRSARAISPRNKSQPNRRLFPPRVVKKGKGPVGASISWFSKRAFFAFFPPRIP